MHRFYDILQSHCIFSFQSDIANFCYMWLIIGNIAYLYPNIINFDEVEFSEYRSTEVISLF